MPSIDERIVQMQFDNKEFEKNVQISMKSLEDLKKALELDKAAKSLENVEKAVGNVDFSSLGRAVDNIASRFSNLGIVGMTAIQNIANKAINAGEQIVKSMTVEPFTVGWGKYAEKTKAVQTIVNATGLSIKQVDEELSKLSWYADETSYSFTDMTSNIGKFTSMNIPLEDSVAAMMGISNWAAAAGQGVNEAGRAMYNLSQAMGAGYVKMIDWKSIQNANMATADFKKHAIDAATALGILSESGKIAGTSVEVTLENFENTLQKGWFTKDVLLTVLKQYGEFSDQVYEIVKSGKTTNEAIEEVSGSASEFAETAFRAAQEAKTFKEAIEAVAEAGASKWMETFDLIFGNYEEAKKLWTDLANDLYEIFVEGGEQRNELLEGWKEIGGRDSFIEGLYNLMAALKGIIAAVKESIGTIFPETTAERLKEITDQFRDWTAVLKETFGLVEQWSGKETKITIKSKGLDKFQGDLKRGVKDQDEAVKTMQERLEAAGYKLEQYGADGIFGPETEAAIKKFQKEMGLAITGVYDEATHNALADKLGLDGQEKIYEKIDKYVEKVNPKLATLQSIIRGVASAAKLLLGIGKLGFQIAGKILDVLSPIGGLFLDIGGAIGEMVTGLVGYLEESGTFTSWLDGISTFLAPVKETVQAFTDSIRSMIFGTEEAPTLFGQLANGTISFGDALQKVKENFKNSEFGKSVLGLWDKIAPTFDKLKQKFTDFFNNAKTKIGEKLPGIFGSVGSGLSKIGTGLVNFASKAIDAVKGSEFLQKTWTKFKRYTKVFGKSLGNFGKTAWDSLVGIFEGKKLSDVWTNLKNAFAPITNVFKTSWESIKGWFSGIISNSDILSKVFGGFKKVADPVKNVVKGLLGSVGDAIDKFLGADTSDIEGFWPKLKARLKAAGFDDLKAWFEGLKNDITAAFNTVKRIFTGEGAEGGERSGLFTQLSDSLEKFGAEFEKVDVKDLLKKAAIALGVGLLINGLRNIGNLISTFKNFSKAWLYKNGGGAGNIIKSIGKALLSAGGSALMMGAGVAIFVLAIDDLTKIVEKYQDNPKIFNTAMDIINGFLGFMTSIEVVQGVGAAFSKGSFSFSINGALSVALGLKILIWALNDMIKLYTREDLDSDTIKTAMESIKEFMVSLGKIQAFSQFGTGGIKLGGPIGVAIGLKIVVGAIADLAKTYKKFGSTVRLNGVLTVIQGLMIELGTISVAAGHFSTNAWGSLTAGGGVVAVAYGLKMIIEAFGSVMPIIEKVDTAKLSVFMGGLTIMLGAMEGFIIAAEALDGKNFDWKKSIFGMASEGVAAGGFYAVSRFFIDIVNTFAEVMPKLEGIDTGSITAFATGVDVALAAIGGFVLASSKIPPAGSLNIGLVFTALAVGIGEIGNVSNNLVDSFSTTISLVGARLNRFSQQMENVKIENFNKLKEIIGILKDQVTDIQWLNDFTFDFDAFTSNLLNIGAAMFLFNMETAGASIDRNTAIEGIPTSLGALINGINDITNVDGAVNILQSVGGALSGYFGSIKDLEFDSENIPSTDDIRQAFTGLAAALPEDDTLSSIASFSSGGGDNVNSLALGIENLATALKTYGEKITKINPSQVMLANNILAMIAGLEFSTSALGPFKRFVNWLAGHNSYDQFILDVEKLGNALEAYGKNIGGLRQNKVETANSILSTIANLDIPKTGGALQFFTGEQNLGKFGDNMADIAFGLGQFADNLNGKTFDKDQITNALTPLIIVGDIAAKLKRSGGIAKLFAGDVKISKLAEELNSFVKELTSPGGLLDSGGLFGGGDLQERAKNIDPSQFENVFSLIDTLSEFQNRLTPLNGGHVDFSFGNLAQGLTNFLDQMASLGEDTEFISSAARVGTAINNSIGSGIVAEDGAISSAVQQLPGIIESSIEGYETKFKNIGKFVDKGIAKGIENNGDVVINAMKALLGNLIGEALKALLINSPSKVFMHMGEGIDEGLVKGINNDSETVYKTSRDAALTSVEGFQSGLKTFSDSLSLPMEDAPVVRPVLDLSDVNSGLGIMNGLFGDRSMAVKSAVMAETIGRQRSSVTGSESVNTDQSSALSTAITTLNDRMSSLETAITNMKVVTETGALIGQIASGMDDKLGELAFMSERRG